jgi:periplasmic protein CpxP/Spy
MSSAFFVPHASSKLLRQLALTLSSGLVLSLSAHAQGLGPAVAPAPGGISPAGMFVQVHSGHAGAPHAHARMDELKASLMLDATQESAWNTWVSAVTPQREAMRTAMQQFRQQAPNLTTPERIERMQALAQLRTAQQQQANQATLQFYAQLRPDQQKRFDQATAAMHQRMREGMRHGQPGRHGSSGALDASPHQPA